MGTVLVCNSSRSLLTPSHSSTLSLSHAISLTAHPSLTPSFSFAQLPPCLLLSLHRSSFAQPPPRRYLAPFHDLPYYKRHTTTTIFTFFLATTTDFSYVAAGKGSNCSSAPNVMSSSTSTKPCAFVLLSLLYSF